MRQSVLLVDDDDVSLRMAEHVLEANGYEVWSADNAVSALAFLERKVPDVILLDIVMPEMTGIELLEKLRTKPATANLPIILVTAKGHDEDVLSGYKYGADYYITKPFTAEQLLYGIRLVLGEEEQDQPSR